MEQYEKFSKNAKILKKYLKILAKLVYFCKKLVYNRSNIK